MTERKKFTLEFSLSREIAGILRDRILHGEYGIGEQLKENRIAGELRVSRTPVREALMDLAKCRVVDVMPQRGSRIALIDYTLVEESRFAREVLEVALLDLVCERITPVDITQLRQNVRLQALTQEPGIGDSLSLMELDDAFHQMLFRIAQMENIYHMLCGMTIHFDRVRNLALNVVKDIRIIEDHQQICEAGRSAKPTPQPRRYERSRRRLYIQCDPDRQRQTYPPEAEYQN